MSHLLKKFPNDPPRPYIESGEGIYFHTEDGRKILDLTAGYTSYAVLGYSNPRVLNAMQEQMSKFCHMDYNIWSNRKLEELAELLLSRAPAGLNKVYFGGCNGSDAMEAAMKLSYHVHHDSGKPEKTWYISREQAFHGASMQAMAVSNFPLFDIYQDILPKNISSIPEHNIIRQKRADESVDEYAQRSAKQLEDKINEIGPDRICAFVAETMMGSIVGDVPPAPNYWKYIRAVCDKYDVHLILDEIYCGLGRSGRVYCCDWDGITPDFICVGKNLAAGYAPLSAVITNERVESVIKNGTGRIQLGHNYQGYSLGVAAALAVQEQVQTDIMLKHIEETGRYMRDVLQSELGRHPYFREIRGRGLIFSLEYDCPDKHVFGLNLQKQMEQQHHIMINAKWHRVSFIPAYIITREQVDLALECFIKTFNEVADQWMTQNGATTTLASGGLDGVQVAR